MNTYRFKWTLLVLVFCIVQINSLNAQDEEIEPQNVQLFAPAPIEREAIDRKELVGKKAKSAKLIAIDFEEIKNLGIKEQNKNFFVRIEDVGELKLDAKKTTPRSEDDIAWYGNLEGEVGGQFALNYLQQFPMLEDGQVVRSVSLAGTFYLNNGDVYYLWPYQSDGLHSLRKWDPLKVTPPCECVNPIVDPVAEPIREAEPARVAEPVRNAALGGNIANQSRNAGGVKQKTKVTADVDHVSVLFVYTAKAAAYLKADCPPTTVNAVTNCYVNQMNLVLDNSGVSETVTRADFKLTTYDETSHGQNMHEILKDLREGNGDLSSVDGWRDASEADVVCLIVDKRGGIAYRMAHGLNDADDFKDLACFVIDAEAGMGGQIRFCHELGHLFGCCHEGCRLDEFGNGKPLLHHVYPHGYDFPSGPGHQKWVTIMGHKTLTKGRLRRPRFSNPLVTDSNGSGPVATGSATSNNAETIRTTIGIIKELSTK
jgi:hypothetical protein